MENFGVLIIKTKFMSRSNKQLIRFSLVLTSAISCLVAASTGRSAAPMYEGKAVSEWLVEKDREAQQNAIRHIGAEGIPTLLDIVGVKERTRKKVLNKLQS